MKLQYEFRGKLYPIAVHKDANGLRIELDDETGHVHSLACEPPLLCFSYEGKTVNARIAANGAERWIHVNGRTFLVKRSDADRAHSGTLHRPEGVGAGLIIAPMPGQVRAVLVEQDGRVEEGQPLILLEAMKMEIRVSAPQAGQLKQLNVQVGQSVERDQVLGQVTSMEARS